MNRPAMKRLIKDLEVGRVDTIIITELDRLSRNISDAKNLLKLILEKNIRIYF